MASKRVKRRVRTAKKGRASWRGMLQFGLVSIPVEAVNAHSVEEDHIAFHQLHAKCHRRIHYEKTCPVHGAVSNDEIVSGYEYEKGKYVEVDPDEIDQLRTEKERNLTVDAFIAPDEWDVIYFDGRMYYLMPDGKAAEEAYAVFLEALKRKDRWCLGTIVMSGKEQPVVVRPYENVLHMALLNYVAEMRKPTSVVHKLPRIQSSDKKLRLAEQLIANWGEDGFDFSSYEDTYFDKVKDLIESKVAGREVVAPAEEESTPDVINLMDALRKSMDAEHASPKSKGKRTAPRKRTSKAAKKRRAS